MEMPSDGPLASNARAMESVVAGRKEDMAATRTEFWMERKKKNESLALEQHEEGDEFNVNRVVQTVLDDRIVYES
ncbi:hypothetical protein RYX36_003400 [Vicia faba]